MLVKPLREIIVPCLVGQAFGVAFLHLSGRGVDWRFQAGLTLGVLWVCLTLWVYESFHSGKGRFD